MMHLLDLVFDPTLAFARISGGLTSKLCHDHRGSLLTAYVDPFAHSWPGLSTTNTEASYRL